VLSTLSAAWPRHTSATADDNSPGWVEFVPELNTQPVQVDLLNLPANGACLLKTLGSNSSLPAGTTNRFDSFLPTDFRSPFIDLLRFPHHLGYKECVEP
jgi:hypothetical protein